MARPKNDYTILRIRILLTMGVAFGIGLLYFLGVSIFTFPGKYYLKTYRVGWTAIQTIIYFIENMSAVQCTGVLLVCSFYAPPVPSLKSAAEDAFKQLISATLGIFLLFGAGYVALAEGALPALTNRLESYRNSTTLARNYLDRAEQLVLAGEFEKSAEYLELYLDIDPSNETAAATLTSVKQRIDNHSDRQGEDLTRSLAPRLELNAEELLSKAVEALAMEDFYTAYYFADIAEAISPNGSEGDRAAKSIMGGIQDRLSSFQADAEELESKAIFEIKTRGVNDLSSDDVTLVTRAYYTFLMLTESYPDDREAEKYLAQSISKLKTMAFFLDEIENLDLIPGPMEVFFINSGTEDQETQLVGIGRVIDTGDAVYFRRIESVSFDADGSVLCRFTSEYGKLLPGPDGGLAIYMRGIDPLDSSYTHLPMIQEQEYGALCNDVLNLRPSVEEMHLLSRSGRNLAGYSLPQLWGLWDTFSPFGYPGDVIQIETLSRIVSSFGFFIISMIALAIGWRLKPKSGIPPVFFMLFIPIFPVVSYFVITSYEYLHRLIIGTALLAWGFYPAFILLTALQFVLLSFSIYILARQSLKTRELGKR